MKTEDWMLLDKQTTICKALWIWTMFFWLFKSRNSRIRTSSDYFKTETAELGGVLLHWNNLVKCGCLEKPWSCLYTYTETYCSTHKPQLWVTFLIWKQPLKLFWVFPSTHSPAIQTDMSQTPSLSWSSRLISSVIGKVIISLLTSFLIWRMKKLGWIISSLDKWYERKIQWT